MDTSSTTLFNNLSMANMTQKPWNAFGECEEWKAGILYSISVEILISVLGLPINVMVLQILLSNTSDSSTTDIFIFNLAVLDAFFSILVLLDFLNLFLFNKENIWYIQQFCYGLKDMGGPLLLCCICLDRYMAVLHPITFTRFKDRKYKIVCIILLWVIVLIYSIAKVFIRTENFERTFTTEILSAFIFLVFCNISILRALTQSGPGRDEMHPVKKKAFRMVRCILAIIMFNYLPPVVLFPFQDYFAPAVFKCYIEPIAFSFLDFSSCTQPLLYLSRAKKIPCLPESGKNEQR
ncbi:C-X-C chemokine receptor type 2-like [Lepisosteus oculatus]|uniref:C-X-C chemokine receptor type 2-like n=1 Tax=Lepisosteus oculatus TaxID=7918 RepID=UPI0035F51EDB